jgi:drug/metabolite transporter (DMT)-like permease
LSNPNATILESRNQSTPAHLSLLAVVALWGSTFVLVKDALSDISPLLYNLIRMAMASFCLAIVYRRHLRHITRECLSGGAIAGFFLALGYQFQTSGLALTTPSKSAFITGLTVVLVPLLSTIPALRTPGSLRPGWNAYIGALIAFCGIAILTAPGLLSGDASLMTQGINLGDLLSLCCALAFAFHLLSLAHFAGRMQFEQLGLLQVVFCTLFMALTSPVLQKPRFHLTPLLVVALVVGSVLGTAVAFTVQSWAQQHLAATHTALIVAAEPVFAWITSIIFLREGLAGSQVLGALLIMAGIGLTELFTVQVQKQAGDVH